MSTLLAIGDFVRVPGMDGEFMVIALPSATAARVRLWPLTGDAQAFVESMDRLTRIPRSAEPSTVKPRE